MVERVAGDGQAPSLDRVGEHDARPVGDLVATSVAADELGEIVTGEVLHEGGEVVVAVLVHECSERRARPQEEPLAQLRARQTEQGLVLLVRHAVDVPAELVTSRLLERSLQLRAVLRLDDVPPRRGEVVHQLLDLLVRDDPVEALAVGVDDPHHVAEPLESRVRDRFPHVAFVQLGVAGECDEARRTFGGAPKCAST